MVNEEDEVPRNFLAGGFGRAVSSLAVIAFAGLAYVMASAGTPQTEAWDFASSDVFGPPTQEQRLALAERDDPVIATLRKNYPQDFAALAQIEEELAESGAPGLRIDLAEAEYLEDFEARIGENAKFADTPRLLALRDRHTDLAESVGEQSGPACAAFFKGVPLARIMPSEKVKRHAALAFASQIEAAASGQNRAVVRERPTGADLSAHGRAMLKAGAEVAHIEAVQSGKTDHLSPEDRCQAGLALWRATRSLPDESSARIVAMLVS